MSTDTATDTTPDADRQAADPGAEPITFNPFGPMRDPDPYPYFRRLQDEAPVGTVPGVDVWYLTRYADCEAVLRHPEAGNDSRKSPVYRALVDAGVLSLPDTPTGRPSMMFLDPPDHTRMRKLVAKAFTPKIVETIRPLISELATDLLDAIEPAGHVELVSEVAYPLVFQVMAALIGVPRSDQGKFLKWSNDMSESMDMRMDTPEETAERQQRTMAEGKAYLLDLVERTRKNPGEDLLSELIKVEEDGDLLSTDDLMSTALLLVGAGTETTVHLICNCIYALLRAPDQLALLRERPELIAGAVEETLRWDPPTQLTQRIALTDLEVADAVIPTGCPVVLLIAAANRDPAKIEDPDRFDITRPESPHLAFALGRHFCLGTQLARAEAQMMVAAIIERFPQLRLGAAGAKHRETFVLRCLDSLPLDF